MRIASSVKGTPPLVLLQHFRGNLDNWDPALINALASTRRVVTFDNAGVGGSTGMTPSTIGDMARNAIAFLDAMELDQVDLLGFSIGSFVAQEIALIRTAAVRRLILASSAPRRAEGMHGWAPEVIGAVGRARPQPRRISERLLHALIREPTGGQGGPRTPDRSDRRSRQANDLANPTGAVRRGMRFGGSRITVCCRELAPSTFQCLLRTATVTQ
jgi:pimeloyl-ACP methyl ester carboxylesterase